MRMKHTRTLLTLLMLVLLCFYTRAMVPKHRYPRDTDGEICTPQTPCAWSIFEANSTVAMTVKNTFCSCGEGKSCKQDGMDEDNKTYIHNCKDEET